MFKNFPAAESAISLVAGAADGFISSSDINAGRTTWTKRRTTIWQGALVGGGVVLSAMNKPKFADPLLMTGLALAGREATLAMAQKGQTTPAVAWGRAIETAPMAPDHALAAAYGLNNSGTAATRQYKQTVSSLG